MIFTAFSATFSLFRSIFRAAPRFRNHFSLETVELQRRAQQLDFVTLEDATCSCPEDETRIRQAIAGHEDLELK